MTERYVTAGGNPLKQLIAIGRGTYARRVPDDSDDLGARHASHVAERLEASDGCSGGPEPPRVASSDNQSFCVVLPSITALVSPDGEAHKPGLTVDGVHPDAAAYAIMTPLAEQAFKDDEMKQLAVTTLGSRHTATIRKI